MEMSLAEMDEMFVLREGQSDRVADTIRLADVMAARAPIASPSATTCAMNNIFLIAMAGRTSQKRAKSSWCGVHICRQPKGGPSVAFVKS